MNGIDEKLCAFLGSAPAAAVLLRALPTGFSQASLKRELEEVRARLPISPWRDRMFGELEFSANAGESRIREWELSRFALVSAYRGAVQKGADAGRVRYSFSHTVGAVFALVVADGGKGIGVDLEATSRTISPEAFRRFHQEKELRFLEQPLDHWVLKEAAYKAHPRSGETVVSDYVVTAKNSECDFTLECTKGGLVQMRGHLGTIDGYRYAVAMGA